MTPPPTMTTLTRVGRSIAMLRPHPRIIRVEGRGPEHRRGAPLALDEHLEHASGCGEFSVDTGECKASLHSVPVGAGCGHADAAILDQYGLAAARVRVGRRDLGVD